MLSSKATVGKIHGIKQTCTITATTFLKPVAGHSKWRSFVVVAQLACLELWLTALYAILGVQVLWPHDKVVSTEHRCLLETTFWMEKRIQASFTNGSIFLKKSFNWVFKYQVVFWFGVEWTAFKKKSQRTICILKHSRVTNCCLSLRRCSNWSGMIQSTQFIQEAESGGESHIWGQPELCSKSLSK